MRTPAQLLPFPDSLIAALDSASVRWPEDGWFIGQLTRLRVENAQSHAALARLASCGADEVWCELLRVYALDAAGRGVSADSVLRRVEPHIPTTSRCVLFSPVDLLSSVDSAEYVRRPCSERVLLDSQFWWIATPFFSEGANLRQVAHVARVARTLLVTGLDLDAHASLLARYGADATIRMRLRYGWPDHHMWPGPEHSKQHTRYDGVQNDPPFWAAEYRIDAHALVPPLALALDPLRLDAGEPISAPDSVAPMKWWPREFYQHPLGRITSSALGQVGVFRRDSGGLVIAAGRASPGSERDARSDSLTGRLDGRTVQVALAFSPAPAFAEVLERRNIRYGATVVLRGEIRAPGLVGFEYLAGVEGVAGGRAHFGVPAVETLRTLPRGGCAISDVLALAGGTSAPAINDFSDALASVRDITMRTLDLGWETYGVPMSDSATTEIEIVDRREPSLFDRARSMVSRTTSARVLRIAWTEPSTQAISRAVPASVPTLQRRVGLNLSHLARGEYAVRVRVSRADGCQAVSSPRTLWLR